MSCPPSNQVAIDQSKFWDSDGAHWSSHRVGWAIAGGGTFLTFLISIFSVLSHCRNYTNPPQQRQILRILYMPSVYSSVSFLSYWFFRYYPYFSFILTSYEAICISAFLLLLIEYVASTAIGRSAERAMERKDKRPFPFPFCCWRYRPTKAYFLYTIKWVVLQYAIVQPAAAVVGIVCHAFDVLCPQRKLLPGYASMYLMIITLISNKVAGYGLKIFEGLTTEETRDRRPKSKFLAIELILMFTFYQSFVLGILEGRVIKETQYWSVTNIANGLGSLMVCVETVFFALFMSWAYSAREYKRSPDKPATGVWRPLWDSINYSDVTAEIFGSFKFYWSSATSGNRRRRRPDLARAFGVEGQSSGATTTGVPSNRTPILQVAVPVPFSSPSLHSQPDDLSNISLRALDSEGSNKETEKYSTTELAH